MSERKTTPVWFWPLIIGGPAIAIAIGVSWGQNLSSMVACDDAEYRYYSQMFYTQNDRLNVCNMRHLLGRIEKLEKATGRPYFEAPTPGEKE